MELSGKNVLVVGTGISGIGAVKLLNQVGANAILYDGNEFSYYNSPRINTKNTHGTGCTLSSAIASNLDNGLPMKEAIEKAKLYITGAIENSFPIGKGVGPVHHFYKLYK